MKLKLRRDMEGNLLVHDGACWRVMPSAAEVTREWESTPDGWKIVEAPAEPDWLVEAAGTLRLLSDQGRAYYADRTEDYGPMAAAVEGAIKELAKLRQADEAMRYITSDRDRLKAELTEAKQNQDYGRVVRAEARNRIIQIERDWEIERQAGDGMQHRIAELEAQLSTETARYQELWQMQREREARSPAGVTEEQLEAIKDQANWLDQPEQKRERDALFAAVAALESREQLFAGRCYTCGHHLRAPYPGSHVGRLWWPESKDELAAGVGTGKKILDSMDSTPSPPRYNCDQDWKTGPLNRSKYVIQKGDGSPVAPNAAYFVLRIDCENGIPCDPNARRAAYHYAYNVSAVNPEFGKGLFDWLNELGPSSGDYFCSPAPPHRELKSGDDVTSELRPVQVVGIRAIRAYEGAYCDWIPRWAADRILKKVNWNFVKWDDVFCEQKAPPCRDDCEFRLGGPVGTLSYRWYCTRHGNREVIAAERPGTCGLGPMEKTNG